MTADEFLAGYKPRFIDPVFVVMHNPGLKGVVEACEAQVAAGTLKKVVRIADPDGILIAGPFDSIEDIPEGKFPNRFHSFYYELEDCEIITGYDRIKK